MPMLGCKGLPCAGGVYRYALTDCLVKKFQEDKNHDIMKIPCGSSK